MPESSDASRLGVVRSLGKKGWASDDAAIAALAIHPLDDRSVPGRDFEKAVRKTSRKAAKKIRSQPPLAAAALARRALAEYRALAFELGESYYQTRYDQALGVEPARESQPPPGPATGTPVAPTLAAGWYTDPYGRFDARYFDGADWTAQVGSGGIQYEDPAGARP